MHRPLPFVEDPHLAGVLLHELDRSKRVSLGRREQLLEATLDGVGPAERVGRSDDREEVVARVELREREREAFDVGRGRSRVHLWTQERHIGPVPARDLCGLRGVGRHHDALEHAGLTRGLDRIGEQRMPG